MTPLELERFEQKYVVEPNSGCWLWDAAVHAMRGGYGYMKVGSATTRDLATQHQVHLTTVQRVIRGTSWARTTRPPSLSPLGTTPRRPRFE